MALVADIQEGARLMAAADTWEIVRVFTVTGLSGNASQRLLAAYTTAGVPHEGAAHPDEPSMLVHHLDIRSLDLATAEISVVYRWPLFTGGGGEVGGEPLLQFGATLQPLERAKDRHGDQMVLSHTYTPDSPADPFTKSINVTVDDHQIVIHVRASRLEAAETNPLLLLKTYANKLNSSAWWYGNARTWLCSNIDGQQNANGTWSMLYEFQWNENGWDPTTYFKEDDTGRVPDDLVDGVGIKVVEIKGEADFSQLFNARGSWVRSGPSS